MSFFISLTSCFIYFQHHSNFVYQINCFQLLMAERPSNFSIIWRILILTVSMKKGRNSATCRLHCTTVSLYSVYVSTIFYSTVSFTYPIIRLHVSTVCQSSSGHIQISYHMRFAQFWYPVLFTGFFKYVLSKVLYKL